MNFYLIPADIIIDAQNPVKLRVCVYNVIEGALY